MGWGAPQISPKNGEPQRYSWGTQKKKKKKCHRYFPAAAKNEFSHWHDPTRKKPHGESGDRTQVCRFHGDRLTIRPPRRFGKREVVAQVSCVQMARDRLMGLGRYNWIGDHDSVSQDHNRWRVSYRCSLFWLWWCCYPLFGQLGNVCFFGDPSSSC